MKCQSLLSEKKKKTNIINLSSTKLAQRVVNVKLSHLSTPSFFRIMHLLVFSPKEGLGSGMNPGELDILKMSLSNFLIRELGMLSNIPCHPSRHDVYTTSPQRCINVMCPLGCL